MDLRKKHEPKRNLTGERFGKLTVISYAGYITKSGRTYHQWNCICECGNKKTTLSRHLLSGHCKSCGCIPHTPHSMPFIKHNMTGTKLYNVWKAMKGRCYTKSDSAYNYYGGRGIRVCDEWKSDFNTFYEWSINNGYDPEAGRKECTLDRIDTNGDYTPDNCRWTSMSTQVNNRNNSVYYEFEGEKLSLREISKRTSVPYNLLKSRIDGGNSILEAVYGDFTPGNKLKLNGESKTIPEWSKITGIKTITLHARKRRGWSDEKTLTTPVNEKGRDLWKYCKDRQKTEIL